MELGNTALPLPHFGFGLELTGFLDVWMRTLYNLNFIVTNNIDSFPLFSRSTLDFQSVSMKRAGQNLAILLPGLCLTVVAELRLGFEVHDVFEAGEDLPTGVDLLSIRDPW
jgi:hypothetical protein